jgi:prepilin-type N-terminal cleavage/methylation domain-containing protein
MRRTVGFTLLEIMIVLSILGTISVIGFRKLNKKEDLKSVVRRFATATREIRNLAKINGKTYRIVIDMGSKKGQSYWVESSPKTEFIDPKKEAKRHEIVNEQSRDPDLNSDGFTPDQKVLKDPRTLPGGWYFTEIETMGAEEPKTEGLVYIHFLNTGVAEEATVQISDKGKTTWTIHVQALIGKAEIYTEKKSLRELTE